MNDKKRGAGKFALGALLGAVAGATLGVLFAPRSGKDTRKIIKEKADDYKEKGSEYVKEKTGQAKEALGDLKKSARETADDIKDSLKHKR